MKDALPTQFLDVKHCFADLLTTAQMDALIEISKVVSQHLAEHHSIDKLDKATVR